jgi:hypothetical protein
MPTDRTAAEGTLAPPMAAALAARLARLLGSDAALYGGVTLALIVPLFFFDFLPLYDLPNHIARQHVLFGEGAPGADVYYAVRWRLIPNLALDGAVYLLHHIVSVETAVRLFVAATVAQLFLGAVALNRALFGRRGRFALAAALFAYNGPLLFGFVNVSFGLGMVLWVFALWLRWRDRLCLQLLFAFLASMILVAHLFAFGVYGLVLGCCWAGEAARRLLIEKAPPRALLRSLAWLVHLAVPVALYVFAMPRQSHEISGAYSDWKYKLFWLHSIIGFTDPAFDLLLLVAILLGALLIARRIAVAPAMVAPLAGLVIAYLALPHQLGEGYFVDYRMPSFAMLFLVGSIAWRDPGDPQRGRANLFILGILALRLTVQFSEWAAWQPIYAEYRAAFALLPQGAKLLPLRAPPYIADFTAHPPLGHVATLAVSERGALIPNLFANTGHQLLVYKPPYTRLCKIATAPTAADAPDYDYLLLLRPEQLDPKSLPLYEVLARGQSFILARILH